MGRSVAAKQIVVFDPRMSVADGIKNTIGIRSQTGRPHTHWNTIYTLGNCPTLVCVFRDENTSDTSALGKAKGVAIS